MAEREFKIKITTDADTSAARQEADALREVGKVGTESAQSIGKETEALTVKKGELRAAVRGLHHEFPELGRIAHLALHPIGLVVAGLAGSFALWEKRVESMTKALAGVELPDSPAFNPIHISGLVEAWGEFNVKLEESRGKLNSIDEQAKNTISHIEAALKRQQELLAAMHGSDLTSIAAQGGEGSSGATVAAKRAAIQAKIKLENDAEEARIRAKEDQGTALMQSALKKESEAKGVTIASDKDDAETLARYKANAEAAQKGIKESTDWLNKIGAMKDSPLERLKGLIPFALRYGYGTSGTDAMGLERENIDRNQLIVDAYNRRAADAQTRDDVRKRRSGLFGEAAAEQSRGEDIFYNQLPDDQAQAAANRRSRALIGLYQQQNVLNEALDQLDKQANELAAKGGVTRNVGAIIMQLSREIDAIKAQIKSARPT